MSRSVYAGSGSRECGFTLVELLIAIAITGLILTILFAGLRVGSKSWDAVERRSIENSELRLVRGFIQRSLHQLRGISQRFEDGDRLIFGGTEDGIEFATPMGGYLGQGGLYVVRLELRDSRDGGQLVLTRWLFHSEVLEGAAGIPEWKPLSEGPSDFRALDADQDQAQDLRDAYSQQVLVDSVEELRFAYYGVIEGETDPDWHKDWEEASSLPSVVRMSMRVASGAWPDLYVSLPASEASSGPTFGGRRPRGIRR